MAKFVSYLIFTSLYFPHFNAENVDKRILMNDPDLVHSQVQAIQRELEKVKTQLAAQVDINTAYQAEIDSLKRSIFTINLQRLNLFPLKFNSH